ncbi:hypothetical protein BOTBODRAFT_32258 [Botryobasidium botryosum FD-172 SS1]|uniref:GTP-binding protein n=1 Tax=Botryobasidium botryosum (strain FD-172 SS1) TaxID=930990 RepID=A0A067MHA2_BOTB1|nr:hypothetical protein BOTBODRAFT_32258 [Botryobasidium botryosum FD-172 SS1]
MSTHLWWRFGSGNALKATISRKRACLAEFSTLLFVMDIQDNYHYPILELVKLIEMAYQENSKINIEIFVHKA